MEPYEGQEPYIFISYVRRDSDKVTPFLEALSGAGYRVWWDKGIEAGADWLKKLFAKVEECAVFCPLFSEAFQNSRYCFIETAWAYHNEKNIVPLYLEELKEDSFRGFYRLLRKLQYLPLYQYADAAEFVDGLGREQAFTPCKAPDWNKIGQIQWRLSADGVLSIAKNENMPIYYRSGSIPAYQHDPVYQGSTAPWMPYRENILSVEIADDIDEIGGLAFNSCSNLTNIRIGDSVTVLGDYAFCDCISLTDVRIPKGVFKIGNCVFCNCPGLTDVRIPDSVTEIGSFAFSNCHKLTEVRIPDSVSAIGRYAFEDCYSLTDVRIPDGVTEIGTCVFTSCVSLTNVRIPDSVTKIGYHAFAYCKSLINTRIPDGVTGIGDGSFLCCHSLTDVRIPDGVSVIGRHAFAYCANLINVRIPDSVTEISAFAFYDCAKLESVEIPAGATVSEHAFPERTCVIRRAAPGSDGGIKPALIPTLRAVSPVVGD